MSRPPRAWVLDQELADTLEHARMRHRRRPAQPAPVDLCCVCGTRAPGRSFCPAHEDLEELDDTTTTVVTTPTQTNGHRSHSLEGKRATGGRREES